MASVKRFDEVRKWDRVLSRQGWWHSFELPDGSEIRGVCELRGLKNRIAQFPISSDLSGKRVLDIGAWDGWFSFEMERRGADVVAIDCWDNPRFHEMRALLGSHVEYLEMDVYDLSPERIGKFDIVLFMGVLYHLKHPLLALERVCSVTKEMAAVDSFVLKDSHRPGADVDRLPIMEFYETDEFGGQTDNWAGPSLPCLMAFCRTAGFARVELQGTLEDSACIACYREWEPVPAHASAAPVLTSVFHHTNFGMNFDTRRDDYAVGYFDCPHQVLGLDDIHPEVSSYGVRPISVRRRPEGGWQCNFKLPPGLDPGWHGVRIRVKDSLPSNQEDIAVDLRLGNPSLRIVGLADGRTWNGGTLDLTKGGSLAIWVAGLPENADRNNVKATVDGRRIAVTFVERQKDKSRPRQVNVDVPDTAPAGVAEVIVEAGPGKSQAETVELLR